MRNRRPSEGVAVAAAAALGVAVAVGAVAVLRDGGGAATTAGPAAEPTVLGEDLLLLDRGPVPEDDALAACSGGRFAGGEPVEVLYGVRQLAADSQGPVVVLRNAAGELRLCDAAGPDVPSRAPVPSATDAEPVALLNARAAWDCTRDRLDRYTSATWLAVDDRVATVRQRLWVDGEPGPWFTTQATGGYAHLGAWEDGPLPPGTELAAQYDVLDADGAAVEQQALPTEPAEVGWCEDGDVQIG
jgi:hypothetical protein